MNARGGGYGMDADLAKKQEAKFDPALEAKAKAWITAITGAQFPVSMGETLHDGTVLCQLVNKIKPGTIKKINTSKMPFKQMENISYFLTGARALGLHQHDCFETVDLFEQKDMGVVVQCLFRLGGVVQTSCPEFTGAKFGAATAAATPLAVAQELASAKIANSAPTPSATPVMNQASAPSQAMSVGAASAAAIHGNASYPSQPSKEMNLGRGGGYGMDADLAAKQAAKFDPVSEAQVKTWIEAVTGENFNQEPFGDMLKDGMLLCKLINTIRPGTVKKVNKMKMPFMQMENISNFLQGCRKLGVADHDCFETVDLYEQKDLGVVVQCLMSLGRAVQKNCKDWKGPVLGPKESDANVREFTDQQLRAGKGMISKVAMGSAQTMEKIDVTKTGITFGNNQSGDGSSEMTKLGLGSKDIMERKDITKTGVTFGANYAGDPHASNEITRLGLGSKDIMERKDITKTGVTFGANYAGDSAASNEITKLGLGSKDIMERKDITKTGITFGANSAGESAGGNDMTKLGLGSKDIMQRTELKQGGITFGADAGAS